MRITVHDNPESCTFQLEGRLAGAWVREVEECRRRTLAGHCRLSVSFDLTGVTFIDADGRAYLAAMHRRGAEFVAADCLTRAIVAQITNGSHSRPQASEARRQEPDVTDLRCNMKTNEAARSRANPTHSPSPNLAPVYTRKRPD